MIANAIQKSRAFIVLCTTLLGPHLFRRLASPPLPQVRVLPAPHWPQALHLAPMTR